MLLTEWNTEDAIAFAREEGREDGLEEGWGKGLATVAQKMKTAGRPLDEIAEFTGLEIEAIQELNK